MKKILLLALILTLPIACYALNLSTLYPAGAEAANGDNCAAGSYALGVAANGDAESCTDATTEIDSAIATHLAVVTDTNTIGHLNDTDWDTFNGKDAVTTAGRSLTRTVNDFLADAELYTQTKCAMIETPTSADNFLIYHVELGAQITAVHCIVEAATSATIEIEQCDVAGDNCTVVTTAIVCDVGGQADDGTIDNPDLDVDDWVRMDVTATSGTPGHVTGCVTFTMDD